MVTKYDLCSDTVALDYSELERTAKIAVRYSLEALSQRLGKWHDIKPRLTSVDAEWMLQNAQALATATTTLYYLEEGLTREVVEVVNRPYRA